MFENVPPNLPTSKEPEDIFSGGSKPATSPPPRPQPLAPVEDSPAPSRPTPPALGFPLRPVAPLAASAPTPRPSVASPTPPRPVAPAPLTQQARPMAPPSPVTMEKPSRSWLRVVLVLIVLGGLGSGAYFFVTKGGLDLIMPKKAVMPGAPVNAVTPLPPVSEAEFQPTPLPASEVLPPPPLDSDGDGLTDEDELRLGTDPQQADSDGDGLLDNEEVRIYKSDPMNEDTDKDGFKDGDEVKAGYNPLGPGRLFQVPTQ